MTNAEAMRARFLRDPVPRRLGALAANLARVRSFADRPEHEAAVAGLVEESQYFIEWTARDLDLTMQLELLQVQRELARWRRSWGLTWPDAGWREELRDRAGHWSDRLLHLSGLADGHSPGDSNHISVM